MEGRSAAKALEVMALGTAESCRMTVLVVGLRVGTLVGLEVGAEVGTWGWGWDWGWGWGWGWGQIRGPHLGRGKGLGNMGRWRRRWTYLRGARAWNGGGDLGWGGVG